KEIYRYEFQYEDRGLLKRLKRIIEYIEGEILRNPIELSYYEDGGYENITRGDIDLGVGQKDPGVCNTISTVCFIANWGDDYGLNFWAVFWANAICHFLAAADRNHCETGNTRKVADINQDGILDFTASINRESGDGIVSNFLRKDGKIGEFRNETIKMFTKRSGFYLDINGDGREDYIRLDIINGLPTIYQYVINYGIEGGISTTEYKLGEPPLGPGMGYDKDAFLKQLLLLYITGQMKRKQDKIESLANRFGRSDLGRLTAGLVFGHKIGRLSKAINNLNQSADLLAGGEQDGFAQFSDMNGDGILDYVRLISPSEIAVAFNNGQGWITDIKSNVDSGLATNVNVSGRSEFPPEAVEQAGYIDRKDDGDSILNEWDLDVNFDGVISDLELGLIDSSYREQFKQCLGKETGICGSNVCIEKDDENYCIRYKKWKLYVLEDISHLVDRREDGDSEINQWDIDINYNGEIENRELDLTEPSKRTDLLKSVIDFQGANGFRTLTDINGDKIPDFLTLKEGNGIQLLWYYGSRDGHFSYGGISEPIDPGQDFRVMMDINHDNYVDFVRLSGTKIKIQYGTGKGFRKEVIENEVGCIMKDSGILLDVNGDGYVDFVGLPCNGGNYFAKLYNGVNFDGGYIDLGIYYTKYEFDVNPLLFSDINGDGRVDFIKAQGGDIGYGALWVKRSKESNINLIESISNGYQRLKIRYVPRVETGMIKNSSYRDGGAWIRPNTSPGLVVKEIITEGRSGPKSKIVYEYEDERIKLGPKPEDSKYLGVRKVIQRNYVWDGDWQEDRYYNVEYYYHKHPVLGYKGAGLLEKREIYHSSSNKLVKEEIFDYEEITDYPDRDKGIEKIVQKSHIEIDRSRNILLTKRSEVIDFDRYGNIICQKEDSDGSINGDEVYSRAVYLYTEKFPYGIPQEEYKRRGSCDGNIILGYKRNEYDDKGNVILSEEGIDPEHTIKTEYQYDDKGNVISETKFGLTTRYKYDDDYKEYVVEVINPEGLSHYKHYNLERGFLLYEEDANGFRKGADYDKLGRKIREWIQDNGLFSGKKEIAKYQYNRRIDGELEVIKQSRAGDGWKTVISIEDEWGKEIEVREQTAGGMLTKTKEYNLYDEVIKVSLPYFSGNTPKGYIEYRYDSYGRIKEIEQPTADGNYTIISLEPQTLYETQFTSIGGIIQKGYAEKRISLNGQEVYEYKSLDGKVIEHLYQIEYSENHIRKLGWSRTRFHYNQKGQLIGITRGHGDAKNSIIEDGRLSLQIEYDEWGRKKRVYDPDKGWSEFSYTEEGLPLCNKLPDDKTLCNIYDEYLRIKEKRVGHIEGKKLVEYFYGEPDSENGRGRLTSVKDESGYRRFHYDGMGNIKRIERQYLAMGESKAFDIEYEYNEVGNIKKKNYISTEIGIGYNYYDTGELKEIVIIDAYNRLDLEDNRILQFKEFDENGVKKIQYGGFT
ncbi:hypothetical protein D6792_03275, partial [Candidatus Parcubacteria bacterium]